MLFDCCCSIIENVIRQSRHIMCLSNERKYYDEYEKVA